jgi:uncharacterized repeat protein (TIGR03806 family)
VGQEGYEELNIIGKGGNYGWAYQEGEHPGPKADQGPAGFSSIPPVLEYPQGFGRYQGKSIIAGLVYRGTRFAELAGQFLFADNIAGNIWKVYYDGQSASGWEQIGRDDGIASFGLDPRNGDVLLADISEQQIKRLTYQNEQGQALPARLSETGAFSDTANLVPAAGVVPYELNVPFWSDGAIKTRWFAVPDPEQRIQFDANGNWSFPTGTVWVKHFELELTNGVASSRRRVETRLLVRNASGVYGVTYRWGNSTTNAALVPEEGLEESFAVWEAGTVRTQVWHYPSRNECLSCHTAVGGHALGFNTGQLNRQVSYDGVEANQLLAWSEAGYFTTNVTEVSGLVALAPATEAQASLEWRVRSYLTANCVQCHQPGGTGGGFWDARITTPLAEAGILNGALRDEGGDSANRVVVPGSLEHSMLLQRVSRRGAGQMPPLGSTVVDTQAVGLLSQWITSDLASAAALATSKAIYGVGETVVVNFRNAAGQAGDWIGLYAVGAGHTEFVQRLYTDGSNVGTAGLSSGSVSFVGGLSGVGNYEARLFFEDSFELEAQVVFFVQEVPGSAAEPSPSDTATEVSLTPTLSWASGAGAMEHRVYLGTNAVLGSGELKSTQSGTTYRPEPLAGQSRYYWRVDEVNAVGTTAGPVWSFSTGPSPSGPWVTTSQEVYSEGETIVVHFGNAAGQGRDWIGLHSAGAAATAYVRWSYTDGTSSGATVGLTNGRVSFAGGVSGPGNYEARLYFNNTYTVQASVSFEVVPAPSGPPGLATDPNPAHGAQGVSLNATLGWRAGSEATAHRVYVGTNAVLGAGSLKATQSGSTYSPGALAQWTTYYWRVDEINAQGTNVGPVWSFTTGTVAEPRLTILRVEEAVALEWEAVAGQRYVIEASTDLRHWTAVATIEADTGKIVLEQPLGPEFSQRFYRAVLAP